MFLTTTLAVATIAAAHPAGSIEEALDLLDRIDAAHITVDFRGEPLAVVIDRLSAFSPAPIRADWNSLDFIGVRADDRVNDLRVNDGRLTTALHGLMFAIGDEHARPTWDVHAGQIVITTIPSTSEMRLTDVYDVRDLIAAGAVERLRETLPDPEIEALEPAETEDDAEEEVRDADVSDDANPAEEPPLPGRRRPFRIPQLPVIDVSTPRALTPGEDLIALLIDHVDPELWLEYGGSVARISERNGVMLVTAAPTVHRTLRDALQRLRRAYPSSLVIDAAIIDLPRAALNDLKRRFDPTSIVFARAARSSDNAATLWTMNAPAAFGQTLSASGSDGDTEIGLEITPRLDAETGLVLLAVNVVMQHGDEQRRLNTTTTAPQRSAVVIELPASAGDEQAPARLLILIPERH